VAISPPIDFLLTNKAFKQGINKGYDQFFLSRLKAKHRNRMQSFADDPEVMKYARAALSAPWLEHYDELVTAPAGGFASARDYYVKASVGDGLAQIRVPTLLLHAKDDPIIPMEMFDSRAELIAGNPALTAVFTDYGGHVGFMEADWVAQPEAWMDGFWAENQALAFTRWMASKKLVEQPV
jgi:predicted alpha/beta-fold hydrolase